MLRHIYDELFQPFPNCNYGPQVFDGISICFSTSYVQTPPTAFSGQLHPLLETQLDQLPQKYCRFIEVQDSLYQTLLIFETLIVILQADRFPFYTAPTSPNRL